MWYETSSSSPAFAPFSLRDNVIKVATLKMDRNRINVSLLLVVFLTLNGAQCHAPRARRETPSLHPGNWESCKEGVEAPATRVNTTARVAELRSFFESNGIDAYLIPNEDAHQSEYPAEYDKRRAFISGFKGSAGYAVVTMTKQALWTDGRYFLEAEGVLDCNWILMRQGVEGYPTIEEWLQSDNEDEVILGASDLLISNSWWSSLQSAQHIQMKAVDELVDLFWTTNNGRPGLPSNVINALPIKYAGVTWQEKVVRMREMMVDRSIDALIVTGLDETAWLFNLRGKDNVYDPFFQSFAIVEMNRTTLYLRGHLTKLTANATDPETDVTLQVHLNTSETGECSEGVPCVQVKDYNTFLADVEQVNHTVQKVWVSYSCNQAVISRISTDKVYMTHTAVAVTKAKKNPTEAQGMKNAHIKDAAALIAFMAKLEKEVQSGDRWTELSAAEELEKYRRKQDGIRGLSFDSISGSGPNGAVIHYSVNNLTDRPITTDQMYLLDSGGQYLDGTTDVTRTFHFGKPSDYQKECYTRVLMGHIDLFQAVWPKGLYGREIDAFARGPLWQAGLIYRHGTGHGIGAYLSVHEGPGRISLSYGSFARDFPLDEYQFFSDEPGYYETDKFGIRIENIVMIKNATTPYRYENTQFLTFDHVTLVPYEPNLIKAEMLSDKQIEYLNSYNKLCRDKVGPVLMDQGEQAGYQWLMDKTGVIDNAISSGEPIIVGLVTMVIGLLLATGPLIG